MGWAEASQPHVAETYLLRSRLWPPLSHTLVRTALTQFPGCPHCTSEPSILWRGVLIPLLALNVDEWLREASGGGEGD